VEVINSEYPIESARSVIYNYHETSEGEGTYTLSASDSFNYYYLQAASGCRDYSDTTSCQVLANLCVLQLYNEATEVCRLFKDISSTRASVTGDADPGWKTDMPWLYYETNAEDVIQSDDVQFKVTFDSNAGGDKVYELEFVMARFSLAGAFLGFVDLSDQLILCPHSSEDGKTYREFGTNVVIDCSLDLEPYLTYSETVFYDLYLVDEDDALRAVPILVRNLQDASGTELNSGETMKDWQLVRRFFIYDNVSGVVGSNAYMSGAETTVLQYPKTFALKVALNTDKDERIYLPYLEVKYRSRLSDYIAEGSNADVNFTSEYTMNTDKFWVVAMALFIVTNFIVIFIWILRAYIWTKNNPSVHSSETYIFWLAGKALVMLIGTWAMMMFWYLFCFTAYWFIFYKMQYRVYVLLPPNDAYYSNYLAFEVVFGIVLSFQLLFVFDIVRTQCNVDYFFIDWETPSRVLRPGSDQVKALMDEVHGEVTRQEYYKLSVSAWRSLFVTNELNELQTVRYINTEFTLLFVIFFLVGLKWERLAAAQPNLDINDTNSPYNSVLRFFLTSFLFLVIGYSQKVIRKLLSTWIPTKAQNFTDLCSISNISVFILDQSLHGYYIHGAAPTGSADGTMEELRKALAMESQGKARPRGILAEDESGLQTYEIYIPWKMRQTYDNMATNPVDEEVAAFNTNQRMSQASKMWLYQATLPKDIDFERLEDVRSELNRRFKTYISTVIMDSKTHILEKTPLQRFLFMPPTDLANLEGSPFFYKDPGMCFERVFLMGREFDLLLMDLLVYAMFDLTTQNTLYSAFFTYLFNKVVVYCRAKFGEWNLSRKTLVDSRFLI
jgi:meckelin